MDYSLTFARHFARLVWLLLHDTGNIDEQKATLRALVTVSKEGPVALLARGEEVEANGQILPSALSGAGELAIRFASHGLIEVRVDASAAPADILGVARVIGGDVADDDGARVAEEKIRVLAARTVHCVFVPAPRPVAAPPAAAVPAAPAHAAATPVALDRVATPPVAAAASKAEPAPAAAEPPAPSAELLDSAGLPAIEMEMDLAELPARPEPAGADAPPTPAVATPPVGGAPIVHDSTGGMWMQFSATQQPKESSDELLAKLDASHHVQAVTGTLDDLVTVAENAAREGRSTAVADVFHGVVSREARVSDPELRRAYVMAIRRLSRPPLLRAVAALLPRKREKTAEYVAVLVRTGEDGADALIDQLTQAQTAADRRCYYDVLIQLKAGVPALVHMLGDARWFVARNAADLLGEMKAGEAEGPLVDLLRHRDDRVRRAATYALVSIGTPTALRAIHGAIRDDSPAVRMQAAQAIAARGGEKSAGTLTRALDEENDPEVQLALLAALGKIGTPDAVQKLVKAAEPEGRFFKKKPTPFRVAAVQALGEARTPVALAALTELQGDRERDVRDAAARLLATVKR